MRRQRLAVDYRWQRWRSTEQDVKRLEPVKAARILFDLYLINEFEHTLLRLKTPTAYGARFIPAWGRKPSPPPP